MGAYEQGGYRPSPTVSCLPSNTRLAVGEHPPPSTPSRHQTMDDVNRIWAVWYNKLKDTYTLQTADIRRQRVQLAVQRKQAKDNKATEDWQDTPSVQGTAYNSVFKKGLKGASAAAGAYGPDANDPDGPPIWHTDPETVKAIQQAFFAGLVKNTPWNRAPDDPAAAPKATPPPGRQTHLNERKTTDSEPYLKRHVTTDRFRELLASAKFTSAAGPSGLSYTLIAHPTSTKSFEL